MIAVPGIPLEFHRAAPYNLGVSKQAAVAPAPQTPPWYKQPASIISLVALVATLGWNVFVHREAQDEKALAVAVDNGITARVSPLRDQIGSIGKDVSRLEGQLQQISRTVDNLEKLSLHRLSLEIDNAKARDLIVSDARLGDIAQQLSFLVRASDKAVSASAWQATTKLLEYRSHLNAKFAPSIRGAQMDQSVGLMVTPFKGSSLRDLRIAMMPGPASPAEYAYADTIVGATPSPAPAKWIAIDGNNKFRISLDGYRFKRAIISNMVIVYRGGPLELDDVHFVNCTFDVTPTNPGQSFANAVISRPSAVFTATG